MSCESASLYLKHAFKALSECKTLRRNHEPVLNAIRTAQRLFHSFRSLLDALGYLDKESVQTPMADGPVVHPLLSALLALEFASEIRDQAVAKIVLDSYQVYANSLLALAAIHMHFGTFSPHALEVYAHISIYSRNCSSMVLSAVSRLSRREKTFPQRLCVTARHKKEKCKQCHGLSKRFSKCSRKIMIVLSKLH